MEIHRYRILDLNRHPALAAGHESGQGVNCLDYFLVNSRIYASDDARIAYRTGFGNHKFHHTLRLQWWLTAEKRVVNDFCKVSGYSDYSTTFRQVRHLLHTGVHCLTEH